MQTSDEAVYLDSSALVKLVLQEAESAELRRSLDAFPNQVSCALARTEVVRAIRPHGAGAVARARQLLLALYLIEIDDNLLDEAAGLAPPTLRTLDAIHVAAALRVGAALGSLVTYDRRMADAACNLGIVVQAPGARPTEPSPR